MTITNKQIKIMTSNSIWESPIGDVDGREVREGGVSDRIRARVINFDSAKSGAGEVDIPKRSAGEAWTEDGFRASWGKACTKADIPDDLTFHDIRGSAVTRLAEVACEVPEIATITGHSLKDVEAILDAH